MNIDTAALEGTPLPAPARRAEALLRRYPDITNVEAAELIAFLRTGPLLEFGSLTGKEDLKPKLAAFQRDHRKQLGLTGRDLLIVVATVAAVLLLCLLLWNTGR